METATPLRIVFNAAPLVTVAPLDKITEEDLYFLYQIERGWEKKIQRIVDRDPSQFQVYSDRLKEEINVIIKMKFSSYFLIVQDMLVWCDTQKIRRGPGRGSAAGSLVAYVLDIVKVDPIKFDLLFSRFLNADRISMPDIDNDIETDRRNEVKLYLQQRYGAERVASISTFATMKVRGGVKDVIRSLNIGGSKTEAFLIADQVNATLPDNDDIEFDEACKQAPAFKALVWYPSTEELKAGWQQKIDNGEAPSKFWEVGKHLRKLEGMIRQTGTHAAGVVISPTRLDEILPMAVDKNNVVVTASDGKMVEDAGFLKIDILGLNTLSIIERCVRYIKKIRNIELQGMPMVGVDVVENETKKQFEARIQDEPLPVQQASRAYYMLRCGKTAGVFQCESNVAQGLLKDLQVNNIEDISAVLALNRPGPLKAGLVGEYGGRKFGQIKIPAIHPIVDRVLASTYNILVYQESCMKLAVECAGFTLVDADSLRKAIGKKIPELMKKYQDQFIEGCYNKDASFRNEVEYETFEEDKDGNPIKVKKTGTTATRLWNDIVFFASYGFNKSHSVSYAFISYYTAFLKANYTAEFWAAQLSYESDQTKINRMIIEAKADGIKVLPVSVNTSELGYIPESTTSVRRSLGTLKAVGKTAIEELVSHRPYTSAQDFIARCSGRKINKKTLNALISAGAFDEFGVPRRVLTNKAPQCKLAFERFVKRRAEHYVKTAGARKQCLSKPQELDLDLLADIDPAKNKEYEQKFIRVKVLAEAMRTHWLSQKSSIVAEEGETLEDAQTAYLKELIGKWEDAANIIFTENEWHYQFIENEVEDKVEWPLEKLIAEEKLVYGTAVSAHLFDNYSEIEAKVMEKFPSNYYTFDAEFGSLGNNMELMCMVEVVACERQFPYKKDPTKYTRLFRVEDRFGTGEVTVFEKSYDEFKEDPRGLQVRVWKPGNIIIVKIKTNHFNGRKSLVYDSCIKVVASRMVQE